MRSAASTEVATGSKELGDQIARLMAAITRVEQGSHPASAPNSPRHRGCGEGKQIGVLLPTPALTMVRLAWVKLLPLAAPQLEVERALIVKEGGIHGCKMVHRVVLRAQGDSNSLQCFRCQGLGHMVKECATPAKTLNQDKGTQGNVVKPPPTTISEFATFPL